uniref:C2H2-type domain-containing protein n=1 Tax=Oryza punctata TaxID=4537 RepID=A0A0E0MAL0_ORYPU
MDKHTCKLCFRRFHNGRALGGHMRSHVMATAAAAAYSPPSPALSLASTSSTEIEMDEKKMKRTEQEKTLSYVLRENPKRSYKVSAGEFSGGGGAAAGGGESSVVQDGESDTESSPRGGAGSFAVSRRRSKRARRRRAPPTTPDPEPASSVSDATTEEDVAMSLVMLSRDSWTRSRSEHESHWARRVASSEAAQNNDNVVNVFDEDEDAGEDHEEEFNYGGEATAARHRSRYQCGACRKVFRSYQALGGHRASLKKGKGGCVPPPRPAPAKPADAPVIHECPFCFRVFDSGQALGGHKRAHMSSGGALALPSPAPSPSPAKCGESSGSIDLNMPATMEDDFELSAVYDAEFASTRQ